MPILRPGTLDHAIWSSVAGEYPGVPRRFEAGDVVLDVGCHTGAFCALAAGRGAGVVGYEASRENWDLARKNTAHLRNVEIRWGAVWRSDSARGELDLRPPSDIRNTGGASVVYGPADAVDRGPARVAGPEPPSVRAIPLDEILYELGRVRLLKIDVEGAEYPILSTSRELDRVDILVGEIHRLTPEEVAILSPAARTGGVSFEPEDLVSRLLSGGFTVLRRSWDGRLLRFAAVRRTYAGSTDSGGG